MRTHLKLKRPNHATVIAYLALFIALGGASFAAIKLPKNSVGTKQIKKNAVTGAKVKDQSLTGKDINLAKLGTVPSATHAASADTIPPAEPVHLVGTPGNPGFEPGAENYPLPISGLSFPKVGFYKDAFGIVHLEGAAKLATVGPIFTLPPGYRPASGTLEVFEPIKEGAVLILGSSVGPDAAGAVVGEKNSVSLAGIAFRAGG